MLPKIFMICLNLFTLQVVLSQTIYSASPTVSTVQGYPVGMSAAAPTITVAASPLPANMAPVSVASSLPVASISPIAASPIPIASPMPSPSPSAITEPKAYFVPGPIPDPKVTVLGDMPSVVEVTPKVYSEAPVLADPGYIEVKAVPNLNSPASKVLPVRENSSITPVKRLTMACTSDDPFIGTKTPFISNQPVCHGISKMDLIPPSAVTQDKINNPIDFDGLLDGFMTCL